MVTSRLYSEALPDPVTTLERYFTDGGISLVHAVFENSFFIDPAIVRTRTPYFPGHARRSNQHYGKLQVGERALWQGSPVRLDSNHRAQMAWERYTGRALSRRSGFGLRHIWGHPWDPSAFTAGWNLSYMPHWAGMLTESQHPHTPIEEAIRQASWDLFFRDDPVCETPPFVREPGLKLEELLEGRPLLVLVRSEDVNPGDRSPEDAVRALRVQRRQSWSNLRKAIASLEGMPHEPFGSPNVEASAKSTVRKMCRETGLDLGGLNEVIENIGHHQAG